MVVGQATFCHFCNADSYDRLIFSLALYAVLLFVGKNVISELDGSTSCVVLLVVFKFCACMGACIRMKIASFRN